MTIQEEEWEEGEEGGIEAGYAFGIPEFFLLDGDGGSKTAVWGGGSHDGEERGLRRRRGGGGGGEEEGEEEEGEEALVVFGGLSHSFLFHSLTRSFV